MRDVPSLKKTEWPVRITDALGIPSIQGRGDPWHSNGDTTDLAWFRAVCDFLGIELPGRTHPRDAKHHRGCGRDLRRHRRSSCAE